MKAGFNPDMLTLARESCAMTQGALAGTIGVSQSKIAKFEAGLLSVPPRNMRGLCDALKVPEDFFFQTDRVYGQGSPCMYNRRRQSASVREVRVVHAKINIIRMQIARLMQGMSIESENALHRMDIDEFDGNAGEIAKLLRISWRLPLGPIKNLVSVIEEAGGIVLRCDFDTTKIDAISQWVPGFAPIFFINARTPGDRVRFTLAHEVGHLVMHALPNKDQERQADTFASAFLMPGDEIKPEYRKPVKLETLAGMKLRWRVSIQALAVRAKALGVIDERRYRSLFTQISRLGWRKSEPVDISIEEPTILPEILEAQMRGNGCSVQELSSRVNAREDQFRSVYFPARSIVRLAR